MQFEPGLLAYASFDDEMALHTFIYGFRPSPGASFSRRLISPGDTVLDVGANVGWWTLPAAAQVGPRGCVVAFEPLETNANTLIQNLALNNLSWVRVARAAIADVSGEADFYLPRKGNTAIGSLAPQSGTQGSVRVAVTTLDRYCEEQGLRRVDILKVDVEGAERRVFLGADRLLGGDEAPAIVFEVGDAMASCFGWMSSDVKAQLGLKGYRVYRCSAAGLEEVAPHTPHPQWEDLLALKASHIRKYSASGALG